MKTEQRPMERPPCCVLLLGAFPPQAQGIPAYCGPLAEALARTGPVHALGFNAMYPRWLFPGVKVAMDATSSVPVAEHLSVRHVLAWYNPLGWLWHALRAPADVVHIQWWSLPLFPVCLVFALASKVRRKPLVVTVHNVFPHEPSPWFSRASRVLIRLADHLIVHSEINQAQLQEHYRIAPDYTTCVPMGVGNPRTTLPDPADARAALGLPADRPTVLFFGTIRPYKGVADLLRAWAVVRDAHPMAQLLIAGKPWEPWAPYGAIIDAAGLGDSVHTVLDYIPEEHVDTWLAAADLVVLPYTHFDAQSAVGTRALAAGKPLLVSACGGLPALVQQDPRWITPPGDVPALAEKISAFLADPADGQSAFAGITQAAHRALSWAASAEAHWGIYEGLVNAGGKRT